MGFYFRKCVIHLSKNHFFKRLTASLFFPGVPATEAAVAAVD